MNVLFFTLTFVLLVVLILLAYANPTLRTYLHPPTLKRFTRNERTEILRAIFMTEPSLKWRSMVAIVVEILTIALVVYHLFPFNLHFLPFALIIVASSVVIKELTNQILVMPKILQIVKRKEACRS